MGEEAAGGGRSKKLRGKVTKVVSHLCYCDKVSGERKRRRGEESVGGPSSKGQGRLLTFIARFD